MRRGQMGHQTRECSRSSSYVSTDSSPYVIETPESRKRVLASEDPFRVNSRVKIELIEGECDEEPRFSHPNLGKREMKTEEADTDFKGKEEKDEIMATGSMKVEGGAKLKKTEEEDKWGDCTPVD